MFFQFQLQNVEEMIHGQRYTPEEKCIMLAIYKRGPRAYRYTSMLFNLPSTRTLYRHSSRLKFKTGVNKKLFDLLESTAAKLGDSDKICTIGWNEMSLTHHLPYCSSDDFIDGFVYFEYVQVLDFATHSLTYLIRWISKPFKQPVVYFFTQNLIFSELAEETKLVIRVVNKTGRSGSNSYLLSGHLIMTTTLRKWGQNWLDTFSGSHMFQMWKSFIDHIMKHRI